MASNCGNCGGNRPSGTSSTLAPSGAPDEGVLAHTYLAESIEDPQPYDGPDAHRTVYVVARGTPDEQFFGRDQRPEAISLATRSALPIDAITARRLPAEAVQPIYGRS
jgi:hypothetical protein